MNTQQTSRLNGRASGPVILSGNPLKILGAILQARAEGEPPPSIRELMARFGIHSPNGVVCHLKRLEKLGLVTRSFAKQRTLVPTCRAEIC